MNQIFILSLITFGLVLGGVGTLNAFLITLSIPFFLYLISGFLQTQSKLNLSFHRQMSTERTAPDEEVTITMRITNHGSRVDALLVEDMLPSQIEVVNGFPHRLFNLKINETFT